MLRRVAASEHGVPDAPANLELLPLDDAPVAVRQGVHHLAEAAETCAVVLELHVIPACGAIETHAIRRSLTTAVRHQHAAGYVLEPRHPQAALVQLREPAGEADVIRMHMRADDAPYRPPPERPGLRAFPAGHGFARVHAG